MKQKLRSNTMLEHKMGPRVQIYTETAASIVQDKSTLVRIKKIG